jgi:hypothetical protein
MKIFAEYKFVCDVLFIRLSITKLLTGLVRNVDCCHIRYKQGCYLILNIVTEYTTTKRYKAKNQQIQFNFTIDMQLGVEFKTYLSTVQICH